MKTSPRLSLYIYSSIVLYAAPVFASYAENSIERIEVKASRYQHELVTIDNNQVTNDDLVILPRTIADWITTTPGVSLNGQGGQFQSYSIRGFSKARIKSEINGVPILTDRRAGNSVAFLPSEFIETIDIRKGPSSAYYGSDAMGGVISTQLKHFDSPYLSTGYQPNNNSSSLVVAHGNDSYSGALNFQKADNSTAANGEELNSAYQNFSGLVSFNKSIQGFDFNGNLLLSRSDDIGKSSATYPNERITIYPFDDHTLANVMVTHDDYGQLTLGVHDQHWQTDITRVNTRKNITDYQSQTINALWQKSFSGFLGQNASLFKEKELAGKFGVEWVKRNNVKINEQELSVDRELVFQHNVVDAEQDNIAIYLHQYGQFNDWQWSVGARADYVNQTQYIDHKGTVDDTYTSFSFSLSKPLNDEVLVQAELGNSFRFATLSERYFIGETPRGTIEGNEYLLPEESIGGQVNVSYNATDNLVSEITTYFYQVDNYIERFEVSDDLLSYRNTEQASIYGIEASINWQVTKNLHQQFTYQYNRGENQSNQTIDDLNPDEFSWQLQGQWENWQITNQFNYRLASSNVGGAEIPIDSAVIWHLNAKWQISPKWQLGLFLNNITNELYTSSADEEAPWQPERSLAFNLKYQP